MFPQLGHIPKKNKDLVLTYDDAHGEPAAVVVARRVRGVPGRGRRLRLEVLLEGLGRAAELRVLQKGCRYALGNTPKHRSMGKWSDGEPIAPLKIQDVAPIRP